MEARAGDVEGRGEGEAGGGSRGDADEVEGSAQGCSRMVYPGGRVAENAVGIGEALVLEGAHSFNEVGGLPKVEKFSGRQALPPKSQGVFARDVHSNGVAGIVCL